MREVIYYRRVCPTCGYTKELKRRPAQLLSKQACPECGAKGFTCSGREYHRHHGCVKRAFDLTVTRSQLELLELAAMGYSNKEISLKMHLQLRVVQMRWCRLIQRIGAWGRTHAVALAVEWGWVKARRRAAL